MKANKKDKILEDASRRIYHWFTGKKSPPVRIYYHPTNRCNLRCKFCWQRNHDTVEKLDYSRELPKKRMLHLVKESYELGVKEWSLSGGGEPMCAAGTFEMMKLIKRYRMFGEVNTNVTLYTEAQIKQLVMLGWDHMILSIDGLERAHDYLRGVDGTFRTAVNNIKRFSYWKDRLNKKTPILGITMVLCKENYQDIEGMVRLASGTGCKNLSFNPVKEYTPHANKLKLDRHKLEELNSIIKRAIPLADELGISTNLRSLLNPDVVMKSDDKTSLVRKSTIESRGVMFKIPCFEPWYGMTISTEGFVGVCCERPDEDKEDNLHIRSLSEIWYGNYFNSVREDIKNNRFSPKCARCGDWQITKTNQIRAYLNEMIKNGNNQ